MRDPLRSLPLLATLLLMAVILPAQTVAPKSAAPVTPIRTIYIIPSSHWDLGFIAPPEEVLPRLKPHLDQVIADCKADPDFRWTIESVWQLREWLARTSDPQQIKDLVDLVNKGQIQVSAVFGSMHTEFMGSEPLNRLTYDMHAISRQLAIKTDFAMMDDVPGFTTRLPQVLAGSGVRYFVNGSNLFIGGGTSLTPSHVPFYWEGQDGSRVLMWQTQGRFGGYTEALSEYFLDPEAREPYTKEHFYPKEWDGRSSLEIMQSGVDHLLQKYADAGYKYDAAMVLYLHDFIPPAWEKDSLLPAVRAWNATGREPRLVVATPAEFFHHIESAYGKDFPVYKGDWSGLWSEVKSNSPRISAAALWVQDHTPVAELLWSLLTFREGTSFPAGNFESARLNLLKYEEHSGSAQVGWPKLMTRAEVDQQNQEYVQYLKDARTDVQQLLSTGMTTLFAQREDATTGDNLVVFNPLSWQRDSIVTVDIPADESAVVRDLQTNATQPTQKISTTQIAFLAKEVPGTGYRTYALEISHTRAISPAPAASSLQLENQFYRVRLRPEDGAVISLFDKQLGQELLDQKSPGKCNALQRWNALAAFTVPIGKIQISREGGPLFQTLVIRRPGTFWPETRITLPTQRKVVEFENLLDRGRMPYVASLQPGESYTFNFAFGFNKPATVWVGNGDGFHRIPDDSLPGARADAAVAQPSLILEGSLENKPVSIVLSERQSFFNYLPGLSGGKEKFLNSVQALAMRKQDQGDTSDLGMVNFQNLELGMENEPLRFDFAITSVGGGADPVVAYRAGADFNIPMIAARLLPHVAPAKPVNSFFMLDAANVVLKAFRPSADGDPTHYMLRLQEVAGRPAELNVSTPLKIAQAEQTNLSEDEEVAPQALPLKVLLGPNQTVTLRLTIPHPVRSRSNRWWEWQ